MLEFRILGPVEVVRDGRSLPLGGAKQRALVVDLTLHANEVLSADRLIDDIWGEEPPETASHLLHVYVSRLRKTFEGDGQSVLVTRAPGYLLRLEPPDEVDAARFELEVRRGVELLGVRPAEALEIFDRALGTWRGRALEEFAEEPFARPSVARLEELRQATHEHRIEALLALGRHGEALVELEALIGRFPLRERPRELQMLALYRSGRQADALQAFQSARRTLADELGVDPGPGLAALEQAILRHDPGLDAPDLEPAPRGSVRVAEPAPLPAGRRPARFAAVVAAAVALAVVAAIAIRAIPSSDGDGNSGSVTPSSGVGLPITWTEISDPGRLTFGGAGDQVILGGALVPEGVIAVGHSALPRPSPDVVRDYDAAVWLDDANGWHRVTEGTFHAAGDQEATDAVAIDGRIVVVGTDASLGDHDAAVWTLEDGSTSWVRVAPDARGMRKRGDQWIRGVTWTGSHVLAVGLNRRSGADEDAAIWTSTDALSWTVLVPTNLGVPGDQEMSSVTTFDGRVVAGGFSAPAGDRDAAVWVSNDDGATWDAVVDDALLSEGDQQINTIAPGGPGLVAVGQETIDGDENAAVWVSIDGLDWQRVEDPAGELGGQGAQEMSAVASAGTVLVAAGRDVLAKQIDAAVWTSTDGFTWTRVVVSTFNDYGGQAIRALLVADGDFLALGREHRGGHDDGDIWLGHPGG